MICVGMHAACDPSCSRIAHADGWGRMMLAYMQGQHICAHAMQVHALVALAQIHGLGQRIHSYSMPEHSRIPLLVYVCMMCFVIGIMHGQVIISLAMGSFLLMIIGIIALGLTAFPGVHGTLMAKQVSRARTNSKASSWLETCGCLRACVAS